MLEYGNKLEGGGGGGDRHFRHRVLAIFSNFWSKRRKNYELNSAESMGHEH